METCFLLARVGQALTILAAEPKLVYYCFLDKMGKKRKKKKKRKKALLLYVEEYDCFGSFCPEMK